MPNPEDKRASNRVAIEEDAAASWIALAGSQRDRADRRQ